MYPQLKPAAGAGSTTRKQVQDLPRGFYEETLATMQKVLDVCDELDDLIAGNEILFARTKGVGVMTPEQGAAYGVSGPNLRGSGVKFGVMSENR